MCKNFPKGKREENNIFLRKSSLSTTENFQLRVSFSRSILRTRDPAYQTSSSLHSSRTKDSLSLSLGSGEGEIHGDIFRACFHGWLEIGNTWLRLSMDFHGFCLRIYRNLHLSERISLFLRRALDSNIASLYSLPSPSSSLITIKNVVHRVEERLSTSLTGLYNRFRNIIIRADVDEINFTSAPRARI